MLKNGLCIATVIFFCFLTTVGLADNPPTQQPQSTAPTTPSNLNQVPGISALDISKLKSGQTTLNVGHYNQLPPFYYGEENATEGFGYDIFSEVAKKAGFTKVHFIGFDSNIDLNLQLLQGKIDVIANSWDLPGMRKQFLLSDPYYNKGGLGFLYFKSKGSFQTAADLKDHKIGVFKHGYADHYWLPINGIPKESIQTYSTLKDMMVALRDNAIDVAVIYYPLAQLAQIQAGDSVNAVLVQPINDVYAVRTQDAELLKALNDAITSLNQDGTLEKLTVQYFNPEPG